MIRMMPRSVLVDRYIEQAQPFAQPLLRFLRDSLRKALPELEEQIKWSMPFFVYKGIILANMAAFKQHINFGFWNGNAPSEPGHEGSLRNFNRIVSVDQLPSAAVLKKMVLEAARLIDSGERTRSMVRREKPSAGRQEAVVPEALAQALAQNAAAADHFAAFSPSSRREYCDWIAEAKREETRNKRLAEALLWISQGKHRHWKYEKPRKQ